MNVDDQILNQFMHDMGNAMAIASGRSYLGKEITQENIRKLEEAFNEFSKYIRENKGKNVG
jgi:hypothetical protein